MCPPAPTSECRGHVPQELAGLEDRTSSRQTQDTLGSFQSHHTLCLASERHCKAFHLGHTSTAVTGSAMTKRGY